MNNNDAILTARDVTKEYEIDTRRLSILQNVDLSVQPGEILGIVGSSGAGKSTLLHLLGLLDTPTLGEIFLEGRPCGLLSAEERAHLRNRAIGFVFQFYHLIPELTALQNAVLPRMICSVRKWRQISQAEEGRAKELLTRFGLGDRLSHKPTQLSGGERQRVAIARALVPKPQILLCDEPTGNLDSKTGAQILNILEEVHRQEGTTLVVVTHDERVAARCSRVVRMKDGRVVNQS